MKPQLLKASLNGAQLLVKVAGEDAPRISLPVTVHLSEAIIANAKEGMDKYSLTEHEVMKCIADANRDLILDYITGETDEITLKPCEDWLFWLVAMAKAYHKEIKQK